MNAQRIAIGLMMLGNIFAAGRGVASPEEQEKATKEQEQAIAAIKNLGGSVKRDSKLAGNPVVEVDLCATKTTDGDLAHLKAFPQLRKVILTGHCKEREQNHLTDAGLKHLRDLHNLEELDLSWHRNITNVGIEHLEKLSKLRYVDLGATGVTKEGADRLERAIPRAKIHWDR